jgi:hypothetical protein
MTPPSLRFDLPGHLGIPPVSGSKRLQPSKLERLARALGLVVGVSLVLVGSGSAVAATDAQLLARHQPVLVLHRDEVFRPVSVDAFLADSRLDVRSPTGWVPASEPGLPTSDPAGCPARPCWRLDLPTCTAAVGVASIACYAAVETARSPRSVVYGAVLRRGSAIVLEYWYWWSYDFWSGLHPPTDDVWQAHEGDWEVVVVQLDRRQRPQLVGYSEHQCGKRRAWARVPRWRRTHPIVYPGLGSHANLFRAGVLPFDLRPQCYEPAGAAILRAVLPLVVERTGGGVRLGPARTRIVRVTASSPSWMRYPGAWGEENLFHAGGRTFAAGAAPVGPAFHAVWSDPVRTLRRWPSG